MEGVYVFGGVRGRIREACTSPELSGSGTWEVLQGPVSLNVRRGTCKLSGPRQVKGQEWISVPTRTEMAVCVCVFKGGGGVFFLYKWGMGRDTAFPHIKNIF